MSNIKTSFIPNTIYQKSLKNSNSNTFGNLLQMHFGRELAKEAWENYMIGTSNFQWKEATIFWSIDINGICRAGETKQIVDAGQVANYIDLDGKNKPCIEWSHILMQRKYESLKETLPIWLQEYIQFTGHRHYCFGEHLLGKVGNKTKPVGLVRDPELAVLASLIFTDYVWLAIGSLSNLTAEHFHALGNRDVVMFPNYNEYEQWGIKAKEFSILKEVIISDLLTPKAIGQNGLPINMTSNLIGVWSGSHSNVGSNVINLHSSNLKGFSGKSITGHDYNNLVIQGVVTKEGKAYDILFDAKGELISPGDMAGVIQRLASFYEKEFIPATLDNVPCLLNIDKTVA